VEENQNLPEAIHKILHEVHNLKAKGAGLSVGGMDKDHQNVIFSILEWEEHLLCVKFCAHLRLGFSVLHQEHPHRASIEHVPY
jgi:hypothetical protein